VTLGAVGADTADGVADKTRAGSMIDSLPESVNAFWTNLGPRSVFLVVGIQDRKATEGWERSGLVGVGCVKALVLIQRQLLSAGLSGEFVTAEELPPARWGGDLVLIGGPDTNGVTAEMLNQLDGCLSFAFPRWSSHNVGLFDRLLSTQILPESDAQGEVVIDYGLIVCARNPLANDDAKVVVLAGCWGYGTAAAATVLGSKMLYESDVCRSGQPFEALVRTVVLQKTHHAASIVDVRPLDAFTAEQRVSRSQRASPSTGLYVSRVDQGGR